MAIIQIIGINYLSSNIGNQFEKPPIRSTYLKKKILINNICCVYLDNLRANAPIHWRHFGGGKVGICHCLVLKAGQCVSAQLFPINHIIIQ